MIQVEDNCTSFLSWTIIKPIQLVLFRVERLMHWYGKKGWVDPSWRNKKKNKVKEEQK